MAQDWWGPVVRSGHFWPSKVGLGRSCRLRLILEQQGDHQADAPARPLTELGTLLHEVLARVSQSKGDFDALLEEALESRQVASASTECPVVPLRAIVAPSDLIARVGVAKRLAARLKPRSPTSVGRGTRKARSDELPSGPFSWSDVWLESLEHELAGYVDHLERRSSGDMVVTEAKTGRIRDAQGRLKRQYLDQLTCYGLLVRANFKKARIQLVLCGLDGEETIEFSPSEISGTADFVAGLAAALPLGEEVESARLAEHGDVCSTCDYRTRCRDYLAWAPDQWVEESGRALPHDVWGTVERVEEDIEAWLARIYLRDPNGSLVSIAHVPRRLFPRGIEPGKYLYAFNLRSFERGRSRRPSNFSLVDLRRIYRGAHDAILILGKMQ